jgi:uncharacterized protein YecE (DUF72 family)
MARPGPRRVRPDRRPSAVAARLTRSRPGRPAAIRIGCSGWSYAHWRGPFYPPDLPETGWFAHYARVFDTVELNNSFYHLPSLAAVQHWTAAAPAGFVFAVKANRYITHLKKLAEPDEPLRQFFDRMRRLGPRLGPILYQLPPRWRCNPARLAAFLDALPDDLTHVFEFRDPTWLCDEVFCLLDRHGAGLCVHDFPGLSVPRLAVGRAAYVRFHGTQFPYAGRYDGRTLGCWARWLRNQAAAGRATFAYFNNDAGGQAVCDAQRLRALVKGTT